MRAPDEPCRPDRRHRPQGRPGSLLAMRCRRGSSRAVLDEARLTAAVIDALEARVVALEEVAAATEWGAHNPVNLSVADVE